MQETRVRSLGQEDPLEKGKATHSHTLAWRIPWTKIQSMGFSPWGRWDTVHGVAKSRTRLSDFTLKSVKNSPFLQIPLYGSVASECSLLQKSEKIKINIIIPTSCTLLTFV